MADSEFEKNDIVLAVCNEHLREEPASILRTFDEYCTVRYYCGAENTDIIYCNILKLTAYMMKKIIKQCEIDPDKSKESMKHLLRQAFTDLQSKKSHQSLKKKENSKRNLLAQFINQKKRYQRLRKECNKSQSDQQKSNKFVEKKYMTNIERNEKIELLLKEWKQKQMKKHQKVELTRIKHKIDRQSLDQNKFNSIKVKIQEGGTYEKEYNIQQIKASKIDCLVKIQQVEQRKAFPEPNISNISQIEYRPVNQLKSQTESSNIFWNSIKKIIQLSRKSIVRQFSLQEDKQWNFLLQHLPKIQSFLACKPPKLLCHLLSKYIQILQQYINKRDNGDPFQSLTLKKKQVFIGIIFSPHVSIQSLLISGCLEQLLALYFEISSAKPERIHDCLSEYTAVKSKLFILIAMIDKVQEDMEKCQVQQFKRTWIMQKLAQFSRNNLNICQI